MNEGFRYRDLVTGSFITRDPLGFVDGPNMYAYVMQNPASKFDPEGLEAKKDEEAPAEAPIQSTPQKKEPPVAVKPTQSAKDNAPKFGIGIEVPKKDAVSGDVLNAAEDPGHTFGYIKDGNGDVVAVQSFGPGTPIGSGNKNEFKSGDLPGNGKWPLSGNANTWEYDITKEQMTAGVKAIDDFKQNTPKYTPENQCTRSVIDLAGKVGVKVPDGKGPVVAKFGPVNLYSGNPANPYHLNKQLASERGDPAVVPTSTFPRP